MHTKEPWKLNDAGESDIAVYSNAEDRPMSEVVFLAKSKYCNAGEKKFADNVRRAAACVNALAGVPDPLALRATLEELRNEIETPTGMIIDIGRKIMSLIPAPEPTK